MPELPDLVHVEDVLREALAGKTISAARTGDPTVLRIMVREPFPALLAGRRLETIERRGQFMRFGLDGGLCIVVNAMLAGRYKLIAAGSTDARKKDPRALGLALSFTDAPELQYVDDKRMGKVYVARAEDEKQIPVYGELGVELLSPAFTREAFCRKLQPAEVDALYEAIGRVLREAIAEIRRRNEPPEIKVRDFLKVRGRDGKPCLVCGTTIRAVRVGDGDACFCPRCQPETRKLFVSWSNLVKEGDLPKREEK